MKSQQNRIELVTRPAMYQLMRPDVKTVINFLTVASLFTALTFCLSVCFTFYMGFPTYTDISMVDQPNAPFPAVTFCPDTYPKAKEEVLKVLYLSYIIQLNLTD